RARQIATGLFPGPPRRARAIPAPRPAARYRGHRGRGRLRGRRDAPLAPEPAPGPGRARAAGRSAVTGPPSGNPRGFERVSRDVWRSVGMPTQVLFIQGAGAAAHDAWDDKLVRSLERELGDGYMVLYPRMPDEADPHYASWKAALLNELEKL